MFVRIKGKLTNKMAPPSHRRRAGVERLDDVGSKKHEFSNTLNTSALTTITQLSEFTNRRIYYRPTQNQRECQRRIINETSTKNHTLLQNTSSGATCSSIAAQTTLKTSTAQIPYCITGDGDWMKPCDAAVGCCITKSVQARPGRAVTTRKGQLVHLGRSGGYSCKVGR
jgi:hypothetical protein